MTTNPSQVADDFEIVDLLKAAPNAVAYAALAASVPEESRQFLHHYLTSWQNRLVSA